MSILSPGRVCLPTSRPGHLQENGELIEQLTQQLSTAPWLPVFQAIALLACALWPGRAGADWQVVSPLPEPRRNHTAVWVPDAGVLVAGGAALLALQLRRRRRGSRNDQGQRS